MGLDGIRSSSYNHNWIRSSGYSNPLEVIFGAQGAVSDGSRKLRTSLTSVQSREMLEG